MNILLSCNLSIALSNCKLFCSIEATTTLTHRESAMNIIPSDSAFIDVSHLPEYMQLSTGLNDAGITGINTMNPEDVSQVVQAARQTNPRALQQQEKEFIVNALKKTKGNIARTAHRMRITRQALQYRLKKYDLKNLPAYIRMNPDM